MLLRKLEQTGRLEDVVPSFNQFIAR